ncbi:MAG TPA: sialidase family protein [Bryobacteraceae bacterium]|nr:sialidase family protein [Bryobacteraceae bacterium]
MKIQSILLGAVLALPALTVPAMTQTFSSTPLANPSGPGSLQPNWSLAPDGAAVFSWIEPAQGGFALRYSVRHGATWSPAVTIATHRHFFHQPAEVPEVLALPGGHWFAHWVEAPEGGDSDAEYVYVSSSTDGTHWTMPLEAHHDHSAVQHGLASMIANPDGGGSIFWLEALKGEDAPVALKRTIVDATGKEVREEVINSDVCGCCPTAVAKTSKGLLLAFRAHTKEDVRDIAVTRLENGKWSTPKIVNADNWVINACPTNAAAVQAKGDHAAVAWFTGAQDMPRELMAFSNDAGSSFSKPVMLSTGHSFGYTSMGLDEDGGVMVSWLEQSPEGAKVLVRRVSAAGVAGPVVEVAKGGKMALGYPKIFHNGSDTFIAWGSSKHIETASLAKKD